MSSYESLGLAARPLRAHALTAVTIVFGDDVAGGHRETVVLSGPVELHSWPMPGYPLLVDDDGHAQFQFELVGGPDLGVRGYCHHLADLLRLGVDPFTPSTGRVRQVAPGSDFPAQIEFLRSAVLESRTFRLAHRDPIEVRGLLTSLPPFAPPTVRPYADEPRGDGPFDVIVAQDVQVATSLPIPWFPADGQNRPVAGDPVLFFASSAAPLMTVLLDPSRVLERSAQARLGLEVGGRAVEVELTGDRVDAAGVEVLLFEDVARISRAALTGRCAELGGPVTLRVGWPRPSLGTLVDGRLAVDAWFELVTPAGPLYAADPVPLAGPAGGDGADLAVAGGTALLRPDGGVKARLTSLTLTW
ncbi:DUF6004 family protein [Actinosynnema sp. NPDC020468]|uniref:DUF6004 family protein n=1 Tax=Actinosynnema sp. NPDC020468 TaxID=3154488 RepID=UPI0033F9772F